MPGITRYSQSVRGIRANHNLTARFDLTDGLLGVSQWEGDTIARVDRVLLSRRQVRVLLEFVRGRR